MAVSLTAQIEELEHEARMRRDVYARQVAAGKMRQAVADLHKERLEACIGTLKWLKLHEAAVKAAFVGETERRG